MEEILLPSKIELIPGEDERTATLVVEPCYHGYGTTLGNTLRRVLLSSLPGAAVTAVKISGAQHEFAGLNGIKEDILEIVLNLKELRMHVFADAPVRLRLSAKGEKEVTAADIEANSDVEIANPELHIATLTDKKSEVEMEIIVERGRGYVTVEEKADEKQELGTIAVDAVFSPVREVGYRVENVRVGDVTNYDRLTMSIETDGTITPQEAVDQSVRILLDYFSLLTGQSESSDKESSEDETGETESETAIEVDDDVIEEKPKKGKKKSSE
ncbi:DNA-directed RNA polymerase subunit alpha [Candidatus Uhrbacteria bacterium CG_4_10_14_0_8_um_filter_58_22]|uniref:DNA-directed RNA polymerase subunit alpha n=1 Tax=Candidatus Uhrbacteria bacterium CG_4_10_14_0_8_um_filter_58_22 TaxID=1975029 RepID=A0A2M7QAT8_9BACT|nr:MAG: DNA-directed RNA polymerase subunit alpha [Parcubacteria group bacterium CG1_02_58_44]PIY63278.1 MAG: DNA-directed RNA polymerase subunit alpha [Candidatus Uhrbacteria bacterium CG_4_10_14_0_8_um_filter_58_22]